MGYILIFVGDNMAVQNGKYQIDWGINAGSSNGNNIVYDIAVTFPSHEEITSLGYTDNDMVGITFVCRQLTDIAFSGTSQSGNGVYRNTVRYKVGDIGGVTSHTISLTIPVGTFNAVNIDMYEYTTNNSVPTLVTSRDVTTPFTISLESAIQEPTVVDTFTVSDFNIVGGQNLNKVPLTITFTHNYSNDGLPLYNKIIGYNIYCKDTAIGSIIPEFIAYHENSSNCRYENGTYTVTYYLPGIALEKKLKENYEKTNATQDTLLFTIVTVKSNMFLSKEKQYYARINYIRPISIDDMYIRGTSGSGFKEYREDMTYTALNDSGSKIWDDRGDEFDELVLIWKTSKTPTRQTIKAYTYFGELSAKLNIFKLGRESDVIDGLEPISTNTYGYSYPTVQNRTLFEHNGEILGPDEDPDYYLPGHNTTRYVAFEVTIEDENGVSFSRRSQVIKIQRRPVIRNFFLTDTENGKKSYNYEYGFNSNLYPAVTGGDLENAQISWGIDRVTLAEWLGLNLDKENKSFGELIDMYAKNFWKNVLETYERTRNIVSPVWFELQLVIKSDYEFRIDSEYKLSTHYTTPEQIHYPETSSITYKPRYEYVVDTYDKDFLDWLLSLDHEHKVTIDKDEFAFYEKNNVTDKLVNMIIANLINYNDSRYYSYYNQYGKIYYKGDRVLVFSQAELKDYVYECKYDNVTGTWDSSKWTLITGKLDSNKSTYNYYYLIDDIKNNNTNAELKSLMRKVVDSCYLTFRLQQFEFIPRLSMQKYPVHWECPKCGYKFVVAQMDDSGTMYVYKSNDNDPSSNYKYQFRNSISGNEVCNVNGTFNLLRSSRKYFECPECGYTPNDYEIDIVPSWLQKLTGIDIGLPILFGKTGGKTNLDLYDYNNRLDKLLTGAFYSGNNFANDTFNTLRTLTASLFSGEFNGDSISAILSSKDKTNSTINSSNTSGINNFKELFGATNSYITEFRDFYKATCNKCGHELYLDIFVRDGQNIICPYCFHNNIRSAVANNYGTSMNIDDIILAWQDSESTVSDTDFLSFYHRMGTLDLDIMAHYSPTGDMTIISPTPNGNLIDITVTKFSEDDGGYTFNFNWNYNKKSYGKPTHFIICAGFTKSDVDWDYDFDSDSYSFSDGDSHSDTYDVFKLYECPCNNSGTYTGTGNNTIVCKYNSDGKYNNITSELTIKLDGSEIDDINQISLEYGTDAKLAIEVIPVYSDNADMSLATTLLSGKKRVYRKNDDANTNTKLTDYGEMVQNSAYINYANINPVVIKIEMLNPAPKSTNIYNVIPEIADSDQNRDDGIDLYNGTYHWYGWGAGKSILFNMQTYNATANESGQSVNSGGAKYYIKDFGLKVGNNSWVSGNNGTTFGNKNFCYLCAVHEVPDEFNSSIDYSIGSKVGVTSGGDTTYYECQSLRNKQKVTNSNFNTYFTSITPDKRYIRKALMYDSADSGEIFVVEENGVEELRIAPSYGLVSSSNTIPLSDINALESGHTYNVGDCFYYYGKLYVMNSEYAGLYKIFVPDEYYDVGDRVLQSNSNGVYICETAGTYSSITWGEGWTGGTYIGNCEYAPVSINSGSYVMICSINYTSYTYYLCNNTTNNVTEFTTPNFTELNIDEFTSGNYYSLNDMTHSSNPLQRDYIYRCTSIGNVNRFTVNEVTDSSFGWWSQISISGFVYKNVPFSVSVNDTVYIIAKLNPNGSLISSASSLQNLKYRFGYTFNETGTTLLYPETDTINIQFYDLEKQTTVVDKTIYADSKVTKSVDKYCPKCGRLYRKMVSNNSKDYYYPEDYVYVTNDAEDNVIVYSKVDMINDDTIRTPTIFNDSNIVNAFNESHPDYTDGKCLECGTNIETIPSNYEKLDDNIKGTFWTMRALECFNGFYGNHTPTYNNIFRSKEIYYNMYDYILNGVDSTIDIANSLLLDSNLKYTKPTLPTLTGKDGEIDHDSNSKLLLNYYKSILGIS